MPTLQAASHHGSWGPDERPVQAAFSDIINAAPDTAVFVWSLPRTGSKFVHGSLFAAWGNDMPPPIYHTHGVTPGRRAEAMRRATSERGRKKLCAFRRTQRILRADTRKIIFTILRDPADRYVSDFTLRMASKASSFNANELRFLFEKHRAELKATDNRWFAETSEVLSVPPFDSLSFDDWTVFERDGLTHILLKLPSINRVFERFLYPSISAARLTERAKELSLYYGPLNTNSSAELGIAGLADKIRAISA